LLLSGLDPASRIPCSPAATYYHFSEADRPPRPALVSCCLLFCSRRVYTAVHTQHVLQLALCKAASRLHPTRLAGPCSDAFCSSALLGSTKSRRFEQVISYFGNLEFVGWQALNRINYVLDGLWYQVLPLVPAFDGTSSFCSGSELDVRCLKSLQRSVIDSRGVLESSWNFSSFICFFTGVECWNESGEEVRVLSLRLSNMGLEGQFPQGLFFPERS